MCKYLHIDGSKQKQSSPTGRRQIQQSDDSPSIGCHGDGRCVAMETEGAQLFVNMWRCGGRTLPNDHVLVVSRCRQQQLASDVNRQTADLHMQQLKTNLVFQLKSTDIKKFLIYTFNSLYVLLIY